MDDLSNADFDRDWDEMHEEPEKPELPVDDIVRPNAVRAYSDFEGHILVRIGNEEHGMDLTCAMRLLRDLKIAIDNAVGLDKA